MFKLVSFNDLHHSFVTPKCVSNCLFNDKMVAESDHILTKLPITAYNLQSSDTIQLSLRI
jgi:hypothetical protein